MDETKNEVMKVVLLQTDIKWMNPQKNLVEAEQMMDESEEEVDLFVLPEMFSTGFCMEPEKVGEPMEGNTIAWMKQQARQRNAAIVGSLPVTENDGFYNRLCFVKPDGSLTLYDKRHLFSYGGEQQHYAAGNQRAIVSFRGVRFLLQVCYDLRFPVWSRSRKDYDAMIYVANWPESRIEVWNTLLKARAIENQSYVLGVNRVGNDPVCTYNGCSAIVDFYGKTMAASERSAPCRLSAVLDMEKLEHFRRKFPVLDDADVFRLEKE